MIRSPSDRLSLMNPRLMELMTEDGVSYHSTCNRSMRSTSSGASLQRSGSVLSFDDTNKNRLSTSTTRSVSQTSEDINSDNEGDTFYIDENEKNTKGYSNIPAYIH